MVQLKYRLTKGGMAPSRKTNDATCFDLYMPVDIEISPKARAVMSLDISFEIPEGYHMVMSPRSSTFVVHGLIIPTSEIDRDYTGNVHVIAYNTNNAVVKLERGMRLVQVKLQQTVPTMIREVTEITETARGDKGIGSTGL